MLPTPATQQPDSAGKSRYVFLIAKHSMRRSSLSTWRRAQDSIVPRLFAPMNNRQSSYLSYSRYTLFEFDDKQSPPSGADPVMRPQVASLLTWPSLSFGLATLALWACATRFAFAIIETTICLRSQMDDDYRRLYESFRFRWLAFSFSRSYSNALALCSVQHKQIEVGYIILCKVYLGLPLCSNGSAC